jgi:hypothetical protein
MLDKDHMTQKVSLEKSNTSRRLLDRTAIIQWTFTGLSATDGGHIHSKNQFSDHITYTQHF